MPKRLTDDELAAYRRKPSALLDQPSFIAPRELETIQRAGELRLIRYRAWAEVTLAREEFPTFWAGLDPTARGETLVYAVWQDRDALVPRDRMLELLGVAP